MDISQKKLCPSSFNTQPPEGGWVKYIGEDDFYGFVSTHSRLKAAGPQALIYYRELMSFNTQPPEGGWIVNLR